MTAALAAAIMERLEALAYANRVPWSTQTALVYQAELEPLAEPAAQDLVTELERRGALPPLPDLRAMVGERLPPDARPLDPALARYRGIAEQIESMDAGRGPRLAREAFRDAWAAAHPDAPRSLPQELRVFAGPDFPGTT